MNMMPTLVPGDLRDTFESYVRFAEYALLHGRDEWSPEYVAHIEKGLERMRALGTQLDELRAEDERMAGIEFERHMTEKPKQIVPWARY